MHPHFTAFHAANEIEYQKMLEEAAMSQLTASAVQPRTNRIGAMVGEGHGDSLIQACIEEALACQDMLQRAPARTPLLTQAVAHIVATVRAAHLPFLNRRA